MSGTTISAGRRRPLVRNKDVDRYTVAHKTRTRWRPRAPTNHGIRGIEFPSSKTLRKSLFWPVTEPTCKRLVLAPIWKTKPFFPWIFPFGHDPVSHVPRCRVPNRARRSNFVLFGRRVALVHVSILAGSEFFQSLGRWQFYSAIQIYSNTSSWESLLTINI